MPQSRKPNACHGAEIQLRGHGCIVLAICLLAALVSFPTGW